MRDTSEKLRDTVKKLRKTLPPLLTIPQYCRLVHRSQASAYNDLRNKPGLAVKVGVSTRFVTDAVLDEMLRLPAWIPRKDRVSTAGTKVTKPKKSTRPDKQTAALRREPEPEARP
jgi:hypothetical protein